jgi:predicted TIM-barrel fold metal-dependent hydrolase
MAPDPTGLVDVHAHFVTERYVAAATAAGHEHPDAMPGWPQWNTAAHLDLMDSGRIQTSILSVSSPGTHFGDDRAARTLSREVNECATRLRASHPTRFGHFASLPLPDIDGALHEIEYALETLNADGFAVETNHHGAYPGDNRYEPVWAELDRRRTVVFVHPTSPPNASAVSLGRPRPMLEFLFDSARAASDLVFTGTLLRHPGTSCACCGSTWRARRSRIRSLRSPTWSAPSGSCTEATIAGPHAKPCAPNSPGSTPPKRPPPARGGS